MRHQLNCCISSSMQHFSQFDYSGLLPPRLARTSVVHCEAAMALTDGCVSLDNSRPQGGGNHRAVMETPSEQSKKTPATMPASEYICREANSFFEEYAALPGLNGRFGVVKKVGLGRVLSIRYSCCLSSFSFFSFSAATAGEPAALKFLGRSSCCAAPGHQSQFSAPPVWYSMTLVSKKLRSFFRSIISLIHGKGFSSCSNSASRPICCARRFAMNRR